jgi:Protein of unknown function, DUF488
MNFAEFGLQPRVSAPAIPLVVMTIGHSTRQIDAFIQLLRAHGVQRLVDVRTVPRSRRNPQFNSDQLSPSLHSARIHYSYMPGLGGFRHAQHASVNMAWHNASFRGYADYMQTPEFRKCLDALIGGSRTLALSPFPDCRCTIGKRNRSAGNHKQDRHATSLADAIRAGPRNPSHLSG